MVRSATDYGSIANLSILFVLFCTVIKYVKYQSQHATPEYLFWIKKLVILIPNIC